MRQKTANKEAWRPTCAAVHVFHVILIVFSEGCRLWCSAHVLSSDFGKEVSVVVALEKYS